MPSLSPYVRKGLKPPLLQQAAFDDIVFKMDIMRNVASRHTQNRTEDTATAAAIKKWGSLPALNLPEKETQKKSQEETQNGDEELQEVAGKLEIRVVPKELINETKNTQDSAPEKPQEPVTSPVQIGVEIPEKKSPPQKGKLERTKSILKQSSKERVESTEQSPKKEQISFAPEHELEKRKSEKRISIESDITIEKRRSLEIENARELLRKKHSGSESSTSEKNSKKEEAENQDGNDAVVKIVEKLQKIEVKDLPKPIHKPIEKIKNNIADSKSESSSSTQDKSKSDNLR